MNLTRRQILTITVLVLYWPAIFILSHIPIPQLVYKARVSDKTIHFLAYFILVFLVWFAISPNKKVDWRRAPAWLILIIVIWYGVLDEWLQAYVGRNADVMDFATNLAGVSAGLLMLSFLTFWPACLIVTSITIFSLTNLSKTNPAELVPLTNALFYLLGYALFTALWTRCIHYYLQIKPPQYKWILATLAMPVVLLLAVKISSMLLARHFGGQSIILSAAGILIAANIAFIIPLVRRDSRRSSSRDNCGAS